MTPVEEIRKAAALMREHAQSAEPGPWRAEVYDNGLAWVNTPGYNHAFPVHGFPEEAQHIASWHPQVALKLADWLEDVVERHQPLRETVTYTGGHKEERLSCATGCALVADCSDAVWPCAGIRPALAVARTYLGGAS